MNLKERSDPDYEPYGFEDEVCCFKIINFGKDDDRSIVMSCYQGSIKIFDENMKEIYNLCDKGKAAPINDIEYDPE